MIAGHTRKRWSSMYTMSMCGTNCGTRCKGTKCGTRCKGSKCDTSCEGTTCGNGRKYTRKMSLHPECWRNNEHIHVTTFDGGVEAFIILHKVTWCQFYITINITLTVLLAFLSIRAVSDFWSEPYNVSHVNFHILHPAEVTLCVLSISWTNSFSSRA